MSDTHDPLTRREFAQTTAWLFAGGMGLAVGWPGARFLLTPLSQEGDTLWVALGQVAALRQHGRPVEVHFEFDDPGSYGGRRRAARAFVVPDATSELGVRVLDPTCTHLGCNVDWSEGAQRFLCPCHGGQFSASGEVLGGPPPAPLHSFAIRAEGDRLAIGLRSSS